VRPDVRTTIPTAPNPPAGDTATRASRGAAGRGAWTTAAAVLAWVGVLVAGRLLGVALYDSDPLVRIGAPPLVGTLDLRIGAGLLAPVLLAAAVVARGPELAARVTWRHLLALSALGALAWAVLLALADGGAALTEPLESRYEYLAAVDRVGDPFAFLRSFTDDLPTYPTHVKGHPPGLVLVLAGMDTIGLGGSGWATALVLLVGALAAPAVLVALRAVAGEAPARAAAPFLVLVPGAVWMATSADALFTGVAAVGIACFAVAATGGGGAPSARVSPRTRDVLAVLSGVVLGVGLHLSYGIAPLGAVVVALALWRRAWRVTALAAVGLAGVVVAFVASGFWWFDGLAATRELYEAGVSTRRPHADFAVINLAAFALVVGPAAVVGLVRLRDRAVWVLVIGALVAITAANASGLSKGETERIWLPFAPWVIAATCALAGGRIRVWLASAAALGLVLQAGVISPW
jgi:hypothetical protein